MDPPQRRQRTLEAIKRLLLRESQAQPLLLVFEDLHWIDSETQSFLDSLIETIPMARLLLLVNYRPEYHTPGETKHITRSFELIRSRRKTPTNSWQLCWETMQRFSR